MKQILKRMIPHVLAVAFFFLLAVAYFAPVFFHGKELRMGDVEKWEGMAREVKLYAQTEESKDFPIIGWIGSMFSGMPAYSASNQRTPTNFLDFVDAPIKALHQHGASIVLLGLISFYILMIVMGMSVWLAIAGAIAFAFASYNIIIIDAGHITKAYVIAYMPLTIAGMWLVFKERWLLGAALTTLSIALSIKHNHIQITYYLAIFCVIFYLGYLVQQIRQKEYIKPLKAAGLFLACILLAVSTNLGILYANYELSHESQRGATELTYETTGDDRRVSTGLCIDFAFMWSYGRAETLTFLIPNAFGGASIPFGEDSETVNELVRRARAGAIDEQSANILFRFSRQFWGDKPFTSGPVYFGAIVCLLFLLGMFVIKNQLKWWMLGGAVLFIFIAWGRNFMVFGEFLFHYFPLYNRFRTVEMALVIPGMLFPIVGIWGLKLILNQEVEKARLMKGLYWSAGITGGLCLIFWLIPGMFLSFQSADYAHFGFPDWFIQALIADREALVRRDAFRSLVYILLAGGLIFWFAKSKNAVKTAKYIAIGIGVLILVDLWTVAKRFVNHDSFIPTTTIAAIRNKSLADQIILQDTDPSFRVLNMNNTFVESHTSFFHKSIGGNNAAKLRRYEDLIQHRLNWEINVIRQALPQVRTFEELNEVLQEVPSLNMLNARYIIFDPNQPPIVNPNAFGNAWFVHNYEIVENADAEMAALDRVNLLETAVLDRRFAHYVSGFRFQPDENASIVMTSYEPVRVRYKFSAATDQLVVFSEIFYPHGWEATINGEPAEHFRVNWTLRAMIVPAGEHLIEFKFMPRNVIRAWYAGSTMSLFVLLFLIGAIGWSVWKDYLKGKREEKNEA